MAFLALIAAAQQQPLPVTEDQLRSAFERGQASNADYRRRAFVERGFRPLTELTAEGREVRRLLANVWLPGHAPGIEIERRQDGRVVLTLVRADGPPARYDVPRETWAAIEAQDAAFDRPEPGMIEAERARSAQSSCHATWLHFESTGTAGERSAGAFPCPNGVDLVTPAKLALARAMMRAALATQPDCGEEANRDLDYNYHACFVRPADGATP